MVGNEILTGKIEDTNTRYLARRLFELGIALRQVVVCPDELDIIVRELNHLRAAHDMVFTSGGVGPTHDDITIDAVAAAFGRPVVESPEIAAMIRAHFGDIVTPAHLRMANMPEGAELVRNAKSGWPTVLCENVYILPGVPEIFERKLDALRERLDEGQRFFNQTVYTHCDEGEIAALLTELGSSPCLLAANLAGAWLGAFGIAAVDPARQAVLALVGDADGVIVVLEGDDDQHRPEHFALQIAQALDFNHCGHNKSAGVWQGFDVATVCL